MTASKSKKPAEIVQEDPPSDPPSSAPSDAPSPTLALTVKGAWKWTRKKRKAVRYVVRGWTDIRIAEDLGVHRNTIKRWKDTAEFRAAVLTEANEYTQRTRFKRVHEAGVFADQFGTQLAKTFKELNELKDGKISQVQLNALQALTRGYSEFRNHERSDFGDNVRRVEGNFTIGALNSTDPAASAAGAVSFKRFIEENVSKIPKGLIEQSRSPGEALVLATRALVQSTDILDKIYEEDKASSEEKK